MFWFEKETYIYILSDMYIKGLIEDKEYWENIAIYFGRVL